MIKANADLDSITEEIEEAPLLVLNALYAIGQENRGYAVPREEVISFLGRSGIDVRAELENLYNHGYICQDKAKKHFSITPVSELVVEKSRSNGRLN